MTISIIVAMSQNRVIGANGVIPWHVPSDLQYFKDMTMGKPVIMGRKTHESIGRCLPGRKNIVITRQRHCGHPGALITHTIKAALLQAGDGEAMIIGGGDIYRQFMPIANRIYLTEMQMDADGDVTFPEMGDEWRLVVSDYRKEPFDRRVIYERKIR